MKGDTEFYKQYVQDDSLRGVVFDMVLRLTEE
jgi:hypothetical protein